VDGKTVQVEIGTNRPSHHTGHLFKLFQLKVGEIEPGLGIELFVLEASKVEELSPYQEKLWNESGGLEDERLFELLDRIGVKTGVQPLRYLPAEHYWPERSYKPAISLVEEPHITWGLGKLRPLLLFKIPQPVEVTAPIPDYPPMLFRYRGKLHRVVRADGPERIAEEWWLQKGPHRDYYRVEDEAGNRYWLFRSGHYHESESRWFMHGVFG
jgi:protein ImuB